MSHEPKRFKTRVVGNRQLSPSGFELTLERHGLEFTAGHTLTVHDGDATKNRSYTIASGERDEHLQILYRLIPQGVLTPRLAKLAPGDEIEISGPYGEFTVRDPAKPILFIATGTGVAPYRAYLRTNPALNTTLVHGARIAADLFYRDEFAPRPCHACISREESPGCFHGRVTAFLESFRLADEWDFYLCGANEMIFDVHSLLLDRGVPESRIFTEAYYYRLYS